MAVTFVKQRLQWCIAKFLLFSFTRTQKRPDGAVDSHLVRWLHKYLMVKFTGSNPRQYSNTQDGVRYYLRNASYQKKTYCNLSWSSNCHEMWSSTLGIFYFGNWTAEIFFKICIIVAEMMINLSVKGICLICVSLGTFCVFTNS